MATRKKGARGGSSTRSGEAGELPKGAQAGPTSATGQAIAMNAGREERVKGKERGSLVPIAGGEPKGDWQKPRAVGAQKEPARWAANGSVPVNSVPSQSGPVPVGAVAGSPEEAERALEAFEEGSRLAFASNLHTRIPEETIARMSRAELQAVAEQRGYDLEPYGGTRVTRTRFAKLQEEDEGLEEAQEAELAEDRARYALGRPPTGVETTTTARPRRVTNRTARAEDKRARGR